MCIRDSLVCMARSTAGSSSTRSCSRLRVSDWERSRRPRLRCVRRCCANISNFPKAAGSFAVSRSGTPTPNILRTRIGRAAFPSTISSAGLRTREANGELSAHAREAEYCGEAEHAARLVGPGPQPAVGRVVRLVLPWMLLGGFARTEVIHEECRHQRVARGRVKHIDTETMRTGIRCRERLVLQDRTR